MTTVVLLFLLLCTGTEGFRQTRNSNNDLYEIRIYESAPAGTKATLNEAFDKVLRESKNCYAQLDSDVYWIDFDSTLMMFLTVKNVPSTVQLTQTATLHLMCASNKVKSINFSIHVTRRNRHPPKFDKSSYTFYVPSELKPGYQAGHLHIVDHDPIIYNSQIGLSFLEKQSLWHVDKNGSIMIRKSIRELPLYKPIHLPLLVVDYGSPQLFSLANVTVIPVSVSQPQNVRINVANHEYQIFEWDAPNYGIAEKYRLNVKRRGVAIREQNIDGQRTIALSKQQLAAGGDYTLQITALDVDGETPSEEHSFIVITDNILCEGQCSEGGRPMCYYGRNHKIEQYQDRAGLHCLCYNGYSSPQCDVIESCPGEKLKEQFGAVDWPDTSVNRSAFIRCPYNADGSKLERHCFWNDRLRMVQWENVSSSEVCKKQSSILVHLGVLANYAQKEIQTVDGIIAIQRFLEKILTFPAFQDVDSNIQNFDIKVAEHAVQVLDTVISRNLSAIPGNTTDVRTQLDSYIHRFSRRVPVPFAIESSTDGIQFKTLEWVAGLDTYRTTVGRRCYLHLPKAVSTDVVRVICMRNTTLYPIQTGEAPVMSVEMDHKTRLPPGTKALIALRPLTHYVNYTCAHFDEKENGWSIAGVKVLNRNFENGFVLCETTHLSIFTLLPESLFESHTNWFVTISNLLPIVTSFLTFIATALLILLVICPRSHQVDISMTVFLSSVLLLHLTYVILFGVPRFISLQEYDVEIYIVLEYFVLSLSILFAIISSNIDLRINQVDEDFTHAYLWRESMPACKVLSSILVPVIFCICSYSFNGILFYHITNRNPELHPINVAFVSTCLVPLASCVVVAISYAMHGICRGRSGIKKTPRWADDQETAMRELTSALTAFLIVAILLGFDIALVFVQTSILRNVMISLVQITMCGALFVFTCYMCSVHLGSSAASTSTGPEYTGNTLISDRRTQDLSRDRLLESTDKSASISPGNATLHGFRAISTNTGYSTQNSVNSAYSSFKPAVDSIFIDDSEQHPGPLVSIV